MDFAKKVLTANWSEWEIVGDAEIGKGSYGKVYKIKREYMGNREQFAALKVIRFSDTTDREHINEIVEEIELMTEIKGHTNIVSYEDHKVIEDGEDSGCTILLRMELLTPFSEYIKTKELDTQEVVRLGIDICKALEVCQKKKIIHRDIKPQNIFVSEDGDFKLGDFGSARSLDMTQDVMTIAGSWPYMAPEVVKFEPYGKKADIYSLGTVLYELLNNGCKPHYPSQKPTAKEAEVALQKKLTGEKLSPPCNAEDTLSEIVMKACEFDSKKRFSSATEMKEELEKWLYKKPKKAFWERVKEKIKKVLSKINRKKLKTILKILACIFLITAVVTGGIFIYNAVPKNNWRKAYETELQKLLNQNIRFSSVFVGEINEGEAPVVAVSTVDYDTYPIPQYVFSYRDGEVKTLIIDEMGGGTGSTTKEDVLFVKGTNLVVFRYFGNSEGTKDSAQQIIYGIENGKYVELENTEDFDTSNIYSTTPIDQAQEFLTEQMNQMLYEYTRKSNEYISYSENKEHENTIDSLNKKLGISLAEDIVFDAYEEYEDIIDEVYEKNKNHHNADTISFVVMDLNGDDIPELIVENGYKTFTEGQDFYSYDSNGLIKLGSACVNTFFDFFYDEVPDDGKINAIYIGREKISNHQFDISENILKDNTILDYIDITDDVKTEEEDYPNAIKLISIEDKKAYFEKLVENRIESAISGEQINESVYEDYGEIIQSMIDQGLTIKSAIAHYTQYDYPIVAVSFDDAYSIPNYIIAKNQEGKTVVFNCNELECEINSSFAYDIWFAYDYACFAYVKTAQTSSSFNTKNNYIAMYNLYMDGDFTIVDEYNINYELLKGESLTNVAVLDKAKNAVKEEMNTLMSKEYGNSLVCSYSEDCVKEDTIDYLEQFLYYDFVTK